jgi:hypothetical protein
MDRLLSGSSIFQPHFSHQTQVRAVFILQPVHIEHSPSPLHFLICQYPFYNVHYLDLDKRAKILLQIIATYCDKYLKYNNNCFKNKEFLEEHLSLHYYEITKSVTPEIPISPKIHSFLNEHIPSTANLATWLSSGIFP